MPEAVRLVVWDLDDTFWRGTVTEGGIQEYVQAHHDIVIELARRGIMSSICSKNDAATIAAILQEKGIAEYFIFPSVSWEPKGMRLAQLVETVQLRAPTIMFIDDNPNNRAEATAIVPGLQVEDETFIARMLDDPRFEGKADPELTRLKQYKLLEERKRGAESTSGSNEDFLRSCDVRVYIEYDIESQIDRAIELINRTNQLNYTKKRLSENIETARRQLRDEFRAFHHIAGLVRVVDKYGDYGFVGFFMTGNMRQSIQTKGANSHLIHFCFSCRTLGMLIEQWVYEFLGRPELEVVGEVLTDLSATRTIDWVSLVKSIGDAVPQHPKAAPQIVLYGGCEAHMLGIYLQSYTNKLDVHGNYVANGIFVGVNYSARFIDLLERQGQEISSEIELLGLPAHLEIGNLFADASAGALFVVNFSADAHGTNWVRHKVHDWTFILSPDNFGGGVRLPVPESELTVRRESTNASVNSAQADHIIRVNRHLSEHYETVAKPSDIEIIQDMHEIISRVPAGAKLIILADHDQIRPAHAKDDVKSLPWITRYNSIMKDVASEYLYVDFISFSDVLQSDDDLVGANHYRREVYLRMAEKISEVARRIEGRMDAPLPIRRLARMMAAKRVERRSIAEAVDLVQEVYHLLMRRAPDKESGEYFVNALITGRMSSADFLRAILRTDEYKSKASLPQLVDSGR
jgi:FkbH-like protein